MTLHTLKLFIMATKQWQVIAVQVNDASITTFTTALNTALAAFAGSGQPGEANTNKNLISVNTGWNGTVYYAIILSNQLVVPS